MRLAALFILLFAVAFGAIAQPYESSPTKSFSVAERRGCDPFTVTIVAPDCATNSCTVDYGNGTPLSLINASDYTHTYNEPGTYTITLVLSTISVDKLTIEVFENTPPEIRVANCGGNRVSLEILDNNYDQYVVDYGDGIGTALLLSGGKAQYAYGSSGTRNVTVRGRNLNSADNCNATVVPITVVSAITAPNISRLEVINDNSIRLETNGAPHVLYNLEIRVNNGSTFQQIKTLYNETVDTVFNLKTEDNFYCFKLGAFNACDNETKYSGTICSSNFDIKVLNDEIRSSWSTASNPTSSSMSIRRRIPSAGSSLTTSASGSSYSDTDVDCGTEYCYQHIMNYFNPLDNSTGQSISLEKCGVAISDDVPGAITNISSVVAQDSVELLWQQPVGFSPDEFSVLKSTNNNYGLLKKTTAYRVADSYSLESNSCYKISYTDVCGNLSPESLEACPIKLTGNLTTDNNINLSWTPYTGYENGVNHYTLEKYTSAGTLLASIDVTETNYTDESEDLNVQIYMYVVKAIPNSAGVAMSISNTLTIIKDPNLFYPAAFTPNGDNLNDLFNVYGQYITSFEMDIYNRWGELMFTTSQLDIGWDGTFKGNAMPEGTYTFVANIKDLAGRTFKKSGTVLLLRKKN
jgi:gliding motility-associated-like protein